MKVEIENVDEIIEKEVIPFTMIDKVPTFPGCPENDKSCFNKKMQQHFQKEFDAELPNSLKLSPGKKRIIMLFFNIVVRDTVGAGSKPALKQNKIVINNTRAGLEPAPTSI